MDTKKYSFEALIGFFVLILGAFFIFQIYKSGNLRSVSAQGNRISMKFSNSDGIEIGSDVKIAGVKIGSVQDKFLDMESYKAIVMIDIDKNINLPLDSSAAILSSGLLGGKFIDIRLGSEEEFIKDGGKIIETQSSMNLEELIAKFAFNSSGSSSK